MIVLKRISIVRSIQLDSVAMADVDKLMRLLRPIYDAIDGRQYKNAIKLCNQKKICDLDLVQVLQAHCLERTGKVDDALRIVRRVQLKKPTDENLLHTMQLVFKLCGVPEEMLTTYEHAAAANPTNKEMHCQLFYGYARAMSLAKQQQLAFKMYKSFGSLQCVGWACLSMLLQVTVDKSLPVKMLPLADKMLTKALRDHPNELNGEFGQLLVQLLQAQDKPHDAMAAFDEFIRGVPDDEIDLGPMQSIDRNALEASLARDIQDWTRTAAVYTDLLTNFTAADDWTFWLGLIDATFQMNTPDAHARLKHTIESLQQLHGTKLRGPWLAGVEVAVRHVQTTPSLSQADRDKLDVAVVHDAIVPYMDRFASKTCCVTDLHRYMSAMGDAGKAAWVDAAKTRLATAQALQQAGSDDKAQVTKEFRHALTARKMLRFLGEHLALSIDDMLARVDTMLTEYDANQWLNDQAVGGQREVQVTDDLLLLTVLLLLDAVEVVAHATSVVEKNATVRGLLLHAATCLEFGLAKSAYNFQMKLLLCRVYALLGAGDAFFTRYHELDIKQIQVDSLSYLVLDPLLALGQVDDARRICESIRSLHRTTARDTPEFISRAYRLGVFSKAQDMTGFLLHKMKRSQMLALATSELVHSSLADLTRTTISHLQSQFALQPTLPLLDDLERLVHAATSSGLSPNHHREVQTKGRYVFEPNSTVSCDRTTSDPAVVTQWLQLRVTVPHLVATVLSGQATPEAVTGHLGTLKSAVQSIQGVQDSPSTLWQVALTAADALTHTIAAIDDFSKAADALAELATQLQHVKVFEHTLVDSSGGHAVLNAHGLSLAATWTHQVSTYVVLLIALVGKLVKPKKKAKTDGNATKKACVDRLKAAIQAHIELNTRAQHVLKEFKAAVPPVPAHAVVAEFAAAVQAKIAAAHDATAVKLLGAVTDQIGFLRSL
ncbi:hypothetical protein DYB32_000471 [Aphanomyces invadans]|uniref:N-terminal acetyltransferase B complex subunit MDM20 homolog n=1 Tax=Aphanomyces invadans TaxID=157072 RepID=A0A418B9Y2_9STRA|nr:hypothetical protein DYB32_000471 [Aphanomyces invadans]